MSDEDDEYVCHECIGDEFLSAAVLADDEHGLCLNCGVTAAAIRMEELAERIKDVIEIHFYKTSSEPEGVDYLLAKEGRWEQPGDRLELVVSEIAQVNESISRIVCARLNETHPYDPSDGEDHPYADYAQYEERPADDSGIQESWRYFKQTLLKRSRYFSDGATEALDTIFYDISLLAPPLGGPIVREINPDDTPLILFRARVCFDDRDLKRILAEPVKEIGPPPHRWARPGRMNAGGISVFYGSLDEVTCLSEVRPPVGSYVVVGRFRAIRALRLLDCDALVELYTHGSFFDPAYLERKSRVAFLRSFVAEISRPVMPHDQDYEYLPTQVVAEYLASRSEQPFDGIIFPASQTGGAGRNVVLFHHASQVEPYDLPVDTKTEFWMGWETEDDSDDSITVFEEVPANQKHAEPPPVAEQIFDASSFLPVLDVSESDELTDDPYRKSSLRLLVEEIQIKRIKNVVYNHDDRRLTRRRSERKVRENS